MPSSASHRQDGHVSRHPIEGLGTRRAAQYVRMSTEHQSYSIENQIDAIAAYAAARNIEIVRTYADTARSGLSLIGRPALARLLDDAQTGSADFNLILVYDVSRWGRFQDTDESAHYEYLCKAAGISIRYCAEPFDDDGFASNLFKVIKRAMAAEYSRELSVKTLAGQCNVVHQGFRPGGSAPYGLRRVLVDETGRHRFELAPGQYKNLKGERVILAPGPPDQTATVRRIFELFVSERRSKDKIAKILNHEGVSSGPNGVWKRARIHKLLTNESYIGNIVFLRRSEKLGGRNLPNPPETWVRHEAAFDAIVDPLCFREAQQIIAERRQRKSDAEVLAALAELHRSEGRLSKAVIARSRDAPDPTLYRRRFGSLRNAYTMVGYPTSRHGCQLRDDPCVRSAFGALQRKVIGDVESIGAKIEPGAHQTLFEVNDQFTLRLAVAAAQRVRGPIRWRLLARTQLHHDVTLVARMDEGNREALDYYLLPRLASERVTIALGDSRRARYNTFRVASLRPLLMLCKLRQIGKDFPRTVEEFVEFLAWA